jgi:hypothetical protein
MGFPATRGRQALRAVGLALRLEPLAVRMRSADCAGVWHACAWDCEGKSEFRLQSKQGMVGLAFDAGRQALRAVGLALRLEPLAVRMRSADYAGV